MQDVEMLDPPHIFSQWIWQAAKTDQSLHWWIRRSCKQDCLCQNGVIRSPPLNPTFVFKVPRGEGPEKTHASAFFCQNIKRILF